MLLEIAVLANLANVFDLETTRQGLARGLKEANPIAREILKAQGMQGLATLKLGIPLIITTVALATEEERIKKIYATLLAGMGIAFALASINNILMMYLKGSS